MCYIYLRFVLGNIVYMIVDGNNARQRNILINKCFYQTMIKIMDLFAENGDADYANKTIEVITAYHDIQQKRRRNNLEDNYKIAYNAIDDAVRDVANKVFYTFGTESFSKAYNSFCDYNYMQTIRNRLHKPKIK